MNLPDFQNGTFYIVRALDEVEEKVTVSESRYVNSLLEAVTAYTELKPDHAAVTVERADVNLTQVNLEA